MPTPLKKEITIILIIKMMLLTVLWYVCFSHPVAPQINSQVLSQHLLSDNVLSKDKSP